MQQESILKIGIDQHGALYVQPEKSTFPYIWRAAMEVKWDAERGCLTSPKPREWTYPRWFQQITKATKSEYRVALKLTPETVWENVPPDIRREIEAGPDSPSS